MLVTARAEYACIAMLELALRYHDSKPVRLVEITEKHGIPQRFLVQILLQMKAAGLLQTTRGAAGGYQLAKAPDAITLEEILGALSRMDESDDRNITDSPMYASLQQIWRGLADSNTRYLKQFTLFDLLPKTIDNDYVI